VTGESTAVFGHVVYSLSDDWELGIGARFMEDDRGQAHIEYNTVPGTCTHNNPGDPSPLGLCDPVYLINRDTLVDNGITAQLEAGYSESTASVSLTRHLTPGGTLDSGILYGLFSQGYLTGAFNDELNPNFFDPAARAEITSLLTYFPEFLDNYEFGFKGTMFDGKLRLAVSAFYMEYTDKQEVINIDNTSGVFGPASALEFTLNLADVDITGVELELRASPWDGGFVSVDLGMLDHEYSSFFVPSLADPLAPPTDASNQEIRNRIPDWTVQASVEHAFLLANGATLTPQLAVYMQDEYSWNNRSRCLQDSYSKFRVRASYVPAEGTWDAAIFGYNVTDEEILSFCTGNRSGALKYRHQAPSQWGAEFTYRFGG
jgi:iron complex outermembrane receptor protein